MICFKCDEEIPDLDYYMVALEMPYANLFFHKACYSKIEDLPSLVSENIEKVYNIIGKQNKTRKNK